MTEKLISKYFVEGKTFSLAEYEQDGGYQAIRKALDMKREDIIETVKKANLRGLGGAGFPTGMKWSFIPQNTGKPVYLVINGDEGEPGTFKDKYILRHAPHLFLEGVMIASVANNVHKAYVYIRGEYVKPIQSLKKAIEDATAKGYLGDKIFGKDYKLEIVVHRGAGAYICGEETGLLESLEGKKGQPRLKPPFPAVVGLFGCPTVINNVETVSYLSFILNRGPEWFAGLGSEKNGGMRLISLSGHVRNPGVYELPLGFSLRKLIYEVGGGIPGDKKLKAVVPGGLSAAILSPEEIDVGLDFDQLRNLKTMAGSGGVIVFDETTDLVKALTVTMRFYAHESCGQCSPCREGTGWIYRILKRILEGKGRLEDLNNMADICAYMGGTTICALADGAAMPLRSYPQKFRKEFEDYIQNKEKQLQTV